MAQNLTRSAEEASRRRAMRLGFRVDADTRRLVKRAADLDRRSLTDYCLTVLTEASRQTIARHESLVLSERDRAVFFDALIHPPEPSERLRRAFRAGEARLERG